jgi:hypothetical protein
MRWRKQYQQLQKRLIASVYGRLYLDLDRRAENAALIAGTGRSGTTWLGDIIASQMPTRAMFEPFHPRLVAAYHSFHYHQYMRPSEAGTALASYCERVLSGRIRNRWIDRQVDCLLPQYRVIKEIRANLFLKWFSERFPATPILFIIRHPCAVVHSYLQLGWPIDQDIDSFLAQEQLIADFLSAKLDLIQGARTIEEQVAVAWCVTNLVPLTQFQGSQLNLFFYERLCTQLEAEAPRLFQAIGRSYDQSLFRAADTPSTTARRGSAVMTGGNRIDGWQQALSAAQVGRIMAIVAAFGLDRYYDDSPLPRLGSVASGAVL